MADFDTTPEKRARLVLVADDDLTSRTILQQFLRKWGYQTVCVANGDEAWTAIQAEEAPSLLLLDWMMPGKDGEMLCRLVKERQGPHYIILITAKDRTEDLVKAFEAGANDYIVKPFDKDELRARVRAGERILDLEQALKYRVDELQAALDEIKTLRGMLPICSYCKRIRSDDNYWQDIESYVSARSPATFSHGICPECYEKFIKPEMESLRAKRRDSSGAKDEG
jgi:phosphoserine phosphatase RsbU/P